MISSPDKICPDCIETLMPNKKKLGSKTNWLVCPKCGYRVRLMQLVFDNIEKTEELKNKIRRNNELFETND
jgi:DNA-directed RNA polymerase subunit M/transcription elongation factor TFIIS